MRVMRAAGPVIVGGVLLSGVIVLVSGLVLLDRQALAGTDKDWATFNGVIGIVFFALMVGLGATVASAVFARWLPLGLLGIAAVAIGLGIYVSLVALDQKPALAPMFIVLHVVFVAAFGLLVPYRLYLNRSAPRRSLRA